VQTPTAIAKSGIKTVTASDDDDDDDVDVSFCT